MFADQKTLTKSYKAKFYNQEFCSISQKLFRASSDLSKFAHENEKSTRAHQAGIMIV